MALKPVPMSKDDLLVVLSTMIAHVKADDSFDGSVEYHAWDGPNCSVCSDGDPLPDDKPCPRCEGVGLEPLPEGAQFWVHGVFRIGNSMGQGGVRMIGEMG